MSENTELQTLGPIIRYEMRFYFYRRAMALILRIRQDALRNVRVHCVPWRSRGVKEERRKAVRSRQGKRRWKRKGETEQTLIWSPNPCTSFPFLSFSFLFSALLGCFIPCLYYASVYTLVWARVSNWYNVIGNERVHYIYFVQTICNVVFQRGA